MTSCPDTINYVTCAQGIISGSADQERGLFAFGPGYAAWLAGLFWLFGARALPVLLIQILLSSLSCVLVYGLAIRLTKSRAIAFIAGLLSAAGITSSVLSCYLLSDTLYVFLFALAFYVTLVGIKSESHLCLAVSGFLFGLSVLVRSIGQFWFVGLLVIVGTMLIRKPEFRQRFRTSRPLASGLALLFGMFLLVQVGWMARNRVVHGIWTNAFTSAGGPATVAALSLHPTDEWNFRATIDQWNQEYLLNHNVKTMTMEQNYGWLQHKAGQTFSACPGCVIKTYLKFAWTNLNDVDYLHEDLLPASRSVTNKVQNFVRSNHLNYLSFELSMIGLGILLLVKKFRLFIILATLYGYFLAMIGAFPWQGSRYFYPGQLAADILTAIVMVFAWKLAANGAVALWEARNKFY